MNKVWIAATLLLTSFASADPLVEEILALSNAREDYEESLEDLFNLEKLKTPQPEADSPLYPIVLEFNQNLDRIFQESISWEVAKPLIIRVFLETYTREELRYLKSMYTNPIGKRVMEKRNLMNEKSAEILGPTFRDFTAKYEAIDNVYNEQLQEIERQIELQQ